MNGSMEVTDNDIRMVSEVKRISDKGNNAEVKSNQDGKQVIYEVMKKRKTVG